MMKILVIRIANHPLYPFPYTQRIIITSIAFCQPLSMHHLQSTFTKVKLVYTIFFIIFLFFSPSDSPSKTEKCFSFHPKSSFCSWDIQIFVISPLPFHTFQIQKDKWKWNNSWCHELACINLQVQYLE